MAVVNFAQLSSQDITSELAIYLLQASRPSLFWIRVTLAGLDANAANITINVYHHTVKADYQIYTTGATAKPAATDVEYNWCSPQPFFVPADVDARLLDYIEVKVLSSNANDNANVATYCWIVDAQADGYDTNDIRKISVEDWGDTDVSAQLQGGYPQVDVVTVGGNAPLAKTDINPGRFAKPIILRKNVASQKVLIYAFDSSAAAAKTGDSGNITAQISKDGGASAATDDTNPTELDSTNHPGIYIFDLTQAETNADAIVITPSSVTSDILICPVLICTIDIPTEANSACDTALSDINLDHLMKNAVANNADMTTEVPDGTVLSNIMTAGGNTSDFVPSTDSLESIGTPIAGALEITYTVKEDDEDTGDPIEGVEVWITTDEAGTNTIWSGTTDASGVVREAGDSKPFLDAGTYYFWRKKSHYNFTNPDTETFS